MENQDVDTTTPAGESMPAPQTEPSRIPPTQLEQNKTQINNVVNQIDGGKVLTFIEEMIDVLTFKRVVLMAILILASLSLYMVWENRDSIFTLVIQPRATVQATHNWVLSDGSKTQLQDLAKSTHIGGVLISDVDLKRNRRTVRWAWWKDPTFKLPADAQQALTLPQAVFDYDVRNTEQMVSILSNEFRCDPYRQTVYYRIAPELADGFPMICRIAVPPFTSSFVGFLSVGVTVVPSVSEQQTIKLEMSRIAIDIYNNDVQGKVGK